MIVTPMIDVLYMHIRLCSNVEN